MTVELACSQESRRVSQASTPARPAPDIGIKFPINAAFIGHSSPLASDKPCSQRSLGQFPMARAYSVPNETALLLVLWHVIGMRMRDLTLKQLTAVLRVESLLGGGVCCIQVPRAQNHTQTGSFPRLRRLRRKEFPEILDVDKSLSGQQSAKCAGKPCYQH